MNSPPEITGRKFLRKRGVAARYDDCCLKTIDRWVAKKILPEPDFEINGIAYWGEDRLDECDRARTVAAGAGKGAEHQPDDQSAHSPPT